MIVLMGATGFTGRLIASELAGLRLPVRLAARDPHRLEVLRASLLESVATIRCDITDNSSISAALAGSSVIINSAGPFRELGEPVVEEAIRQGIHYVDITGEQRFIHTVYDKYGAAAKKAGVALVPACAFEYALGDAAAALACQALPESECMEIIYHIDRSGTSRGTRKSIVGVLGTPGFLLRDAVLSPAPLGSIWREANIPRVGRCFAYSFPGGEPLMLPLHTRVRDVTTLMALPLSPAMYKLLAGISKALMTSPLGKLLSHLVGRGRPGPAGDERSATRFTVLCTAKGAGRQSQVVVTGRDPYGLTATLAANVAGQLYKSGHGISGKVTPSMATGANFIRKITEQAGASWQVSTEAGQHSNLSTDTFLFQSDWYCQ